MLESVEWGEYRLGDLFEILSSKKRFDANKVVIGDKGHPYVVRTSQNNGIRGFIEADESYLNDGNTISFGQDTATMYYQPTPYFTGDKIKVLRPKFEQFTSRNAQFFISCLKKPFMSFSWGASSFNVKTLAQQVIQLPTSNSEIDYEFMERFIAELNAARLAELNAYLTITGLKDYTLTPEEEQAVRDFEDGNVEWGKYRLGELFGEATRGKRLKSEDRISGNLPFVTAGEADMGVSAFIGNEVEVFQPNTITIDMFGSAKYRNYTYGADDHVAVVHTQCLSKYAVLFITSAIHKVANSGDFHYGRNFYAKDAAPLIVSLFDWQGSPDYGRMETFISAIQKLVIKDVVLYADREIEATKRVIDKTSKSKVVSQKGSIPKSV
ncbi:restriction endonuclease subunit S [Porphyromonas somerae]|uniref:restriction endonuclease subunit S n=1 Tax=Porphyromonas somerae TaxID=322095 RepID=UPI002A7FD665|nr:restriction endonuclease subunit S [Porphyromonas somerae]MDY3885163.1 restriction endonuclease subunit S [Porphyromonas somerae]